MRHPDSAAYCALLRQKIKAGAIADGRRIHDQLRAAGSDGETFPGNLLVQLYGECGCLGDAQRAFHRIFRKNVFSWTALLVAHNRNGLFAEARDLLARMPCHNAVAWTAVVGGFAQLGFMRQAKMLFDSIPELSAIPCNVMINAYGQNGFVQQAKRMFDDTLERDVVSWNSLMAAYAQNGHCKDAVHLFTIMDLEGVDIDEISFLTVIDACTNLGEFFLAKGIHSSIEDSALSSRLDSMAFTSIVNMYGKCGRVEDARRVFEGIPLLEHDVVSWTAIITVYSQNGEAKRAIELFRIMGVEGVEPNRVTFVTVLDSCAELEELATGRIIHAEVINSKLPVDIIMGTALVKLYGTFGCWDEASQVFEKLSREDEKGDVILWNAMISAYALNGFNTEALELFWKLSHSGMKPDKASFVAALDACSNSLALKQGKLLHSGILEHGYESDLVVGTALVNMYGKCGSLDSALEFFQGMKKRNFITWNAMMGSFAENGHGMRACGVYREMEQEGVLSDQVTFLSVLFASSHAGLVTDALEFYHSLQDDYGLRPGLEHYRCIVDLLGRLGQLEDSEEVLSYMPFEPDAAAWMALLGSCKIHGDVGRGGRVARLILRLDPHNLAACRLWSSTPTSSSDDWLADE
ncbi:pentatricopeptide repeat-containing protein DOT4, chloroplastic [Selaginella moellendorffii]|uniref:pentatricopeptide repeat-containing protein DOT4, chloroplastic n=1 Tax=Selaginella moellendorffii TaxID=88036 RepID=UPI000D1C91CB|nr:pentatricopeptide repeat-containing protein DOT4, chloroplastic [Selaginella moellendorffii]|eukprot:XP_024541243.1 pentatricopeptide repeat-containing protein DOT4, chloroplastic [Selaginella moellendorffii]